MAVRKIKGSWWVDFRFNGARFRKRSPDNSRAGARVYETTLRHKLAQGKLLDRDNDGQNQQAQTFEKFAWQWFELYVKNNNKMSEVCGKQSILKTHLNPFFGKTPVNRISNLQIEQYKAKKISASLSNKTINNHLSVLSKCLRTAEEWFDLEKIPRIKRLKVPPQKFDFLTQQESQLLLGHAHGVWYELILVALKTGLRFGELRALDWSDINWEIKVLTVRRSLCRNVIGPPKSNKERHIPLTDEVCQALARRRQEKGLVFVDQSHQPFSQMRFYRELRAICRQAGLRKIRWHTLRHSFASHLAMAGASMKAIQELLGHADITTTLRYAHLTPTALKEAVSLLEPKRQPRNFGQPAVNWHPDSPETCEKITSKRGSFQANLTQKQEPKLLSGILSG